MTIAITVGVRKMEGVTSPEIKSIFFVVKTNGLYLATGSARPIREIRATIPPVNNMLVNVCLKRTHPTIRILKYRKPTTQRADAANTMCESAISSHKR